MSYPHPMLPTHRVNAIVIWSALPAIIKKAMFTFDEKKHVYTLDGVALSGTTSVLQVIAKPMLIQWAANQAVEYIKANALVKGPETSVIPNKAIDEAKTAHRKKKEAAGDWGTSLHKHVENYAKDGVVPLIEDAMMKMAFEHFISWAADKKILGSEIRIYSRAMWVGGTCDLVVEIDGQVWLVDLKTGSGIYPEHFWQMGSYDMCVGEMGLFPKVAGYIVLNLKKDGTFEEKRSISNEDNQKAFLAALTIYRIQEKIKKQVL